MKKINFIDLKAQYGAYKDEIDRAIASVLDSCAFIMGPEVSSLEESLSSYTGATHSFGCASGTDALLLALMALGVGPGDEIITTPFSFIATAEVIPLLGAKPVFVDIDEDTYNINAAGIEQAITDKTSAIIPVSLYGQCADMQEINAIAAAHKLPVIEDAAQSFGALYQDRKSCNLSTIGCTSFFPSKPLGCYGDGGAVFTSDTEIADRLRLIRNHGQEKRYHHKVIGINGRLDTLQAAVLEVKLRHFPGEVEKRQQIGERYTAALQDSPAIVPVIKSDRTSVYAQYSILVPERDAIIKSLNEAGIPTAVHYPKPLYAQEAFRYLGVDAAAFLNTEKASAGIMSLPMSPFLTEQDQDYIIENIIRHLE